MDRKKVWEKIKKTLWFLLNPRFILCFGLGWMITNGWSYILIALGTLLKIEWMVVVGGGYLAFLWLPFSPEKIITILIAIALLKWLFPHDQKTLAVLHAMRVKLVDTIRSKKEKRKKKKSDEA